MAGSTAAVEQVERERKFDVPEGWTLPAPDRLVPGGRVEHSAVRIDTTYYDTASCALLANRVTLRRRTGDIDTGWQLKVPTGDDRTEIRLPLNGRGVPAELRDATAGVRVRGALKPVARLHTDREVHRLVAVDGTALAEIVVDEVRTDTDRAWREVEVELISGDKKDLARVDRWLRGKGAARAASPSKLARALDMRQAEVDISRLSGLIKAYLDEQYDVLMWRDIDLRRGHGVVHPTRVATRRYRSVLRELAGLLDTARAEHLDGELRWYAGVLGEVRDREVLRKHLDDMADALSEDIPITKLLDRLHRVLAAEQAAAEDVLAQTLRSPRYFRLLAELRAWHDKLPIRRDRSAAKIEKFVRRAERTVAKRRADLPRGSGRDAALHRVRKAAKRSRYIADLAQPELGSAARTVSRRNKKLQERLGDRQDAVVAAAFLERLGVSSDVATYALGVLHERQLGELHRLSRSV